MQRPPSSGPVSASHRGLVGALRLRLRSAAQGRRPGEHPDDPPPAGAAPSPSAAALRVRSLRRMLLAPLFWAWAVGLALSVVLAWHLARYAAGTAFDQQLRDQTGAIATQVRWGPQGPSIELSTQTLQLLAGDHDDRNAFMVVDEDGRILGGVGDLPQPGNRTRSLDRPVLFDASYLGEPVRGAVVWVTSSMLDQVVMVVVVETTRRRARLIQDLQVGLLVPLLVLGLLTFAMLQWSIRRGVEPLREVAREVSARDSADLRALPTEGVPREVLPLVERINALLENVRQAVDSQRRFVADAAHQLRTPVAGLKVLAGQLQEELQGAGPAVAAAPLADALQAAAARLARLTGQLLSLARAEETLSPQYRLQPVDLVAVVQDACAPLVPRALREGRDIALLAPPHPVWAWGDPVWVGEIVVNLLDNALRYGGRSIEVRLSAAGGGGGCVVEVADDGAGIPAAVHDRVFEPFWRGERADRRNDDGSGLGLAIARDIALRLGGRLVLMSRPQVQGTVFRLELAPVPAAAAAADVAGATDRPAASTPADQR